MNNLQEQNELKETLDKVSTNEDIEKAALSFAAAGISVLPLKDKIPTIKWTILQSEIASPVEITNWYKKPNIYIGLVCGKVSGNLEALDFDEKNNLDSEELFSRFKNLVDTQAPHLASKLVIERSISGGYHALYRCDKIDGSQKLAMRVPTLKEIEAAKVKGETAGPVTLIETRGERGYLMCAPSIGYKIIHGSIENIQTITSEQRDLLVNIAQGFNQVEDEEPVFDSPPNLDSFDKRPGDDFNLRGDIRPVLKKYGWSMVGRHQHGEYWRRPDKTFGVSAVLKTGGENSTPIFIVYSTNAFPLQTGKHSYFSVLCRLKYGGDWSKTAASLVKNGFGSTTISLAEEYLSARYEFRINLVTTKTEYRIIGDVSYKIINDVELNSLFRQLQKYHIAISKDTLAGLLNSDFVQSYDPFIEYYKLLPVWDGVTDYIEQLARTVDLKYSSDLDDAKKKAESDLFVTYLKKWLVNAVGCAIQPEVVNHTALIFVGPQGHYKSTWLNRLVPKSLDTYKFIGTINPEDKDTLLHLSECYLINLDELETLNKHALGSLKSIMTLPHINVRRVYGRFNDNYIRRASFVGSINKTEFLNDETGSRRFLTFEVESVNAGHSIDMDMVHAQAFALYKSGFQYWFGKDEIQIINTRNKQFAVNTTEDEIINKYFECVELDEKQQPKTLCEWLTATEIAGFVKDSLGYPVTSDSAKKFGTALTKARFGSKKSGVKKYAVINNLPLPEEKKNGSDFSVNLTNALKLKDWSAS